MRKKLVVAIVLLTLACTTLCACNVLNPEEPPAQEADSPTNEVQPTHEESPETTPTDQPVTAGRTRTVVVLSASGTVTIQETPDADPRDVLVGEILSESARLTTGDDGEAILELDDGTLMLVDSESNVELTALTGTPASPITRFFLNIGEVFAFREGVEPLPEGAAFEVETPRGVATIRGSAMNVRFRPVSIDLPETAVMTTICLAGTCANRGAQDEEEIPLTEGEQVEVDTEGASGEVAAASAEDIQRGQEAQDRASEAASQTESITLCHYTGDPERPYIELHISYNAAEGHGHEDHENDLIPMPEGGCPQTAEAPEETDTPEPTATRTPAPTRTPMPTVPPTPTMSGDGGGGGETSGLCEPSLPYAVGTEPEAPAGYQAVYLRRADTHTVAPDTPIWIQVGGWGANGADCAAQNAEHLTMTLTIDNQAVALTRSDIFPCTLGENAYCVSWYATIPALAEGAHEASYTFSADTTIQDGYHPDEWFGPGRISFGNYAIYSGTSPETDNPPNTSDPIVTMMHEMPSGDRYCEPNIVPAGRIVFNRAIGRWETPEQVLAAVGTTYPPIVANGVSLTIEPVWKQAVPEWHTSYPEDPDPGWGLSAQVAVTLEPGVYQITSLWLHDLKTCTDFTVTAP